MKVALVHEFLNQRGGAEKVLEGITEIFPDAPIYTLVYNKKKMGEMFKNKDIRTSFLQKMPFGVSKYKWYLTYMPAAIESFDLSEYDLVISDSSAFAKGAITQPGTKHICYCHTPTRYLWQISSFYLDNSGAPGIAKKILPLYLSRLRTWDYLAAQRPEFFIANSQTTKDRIKKYYHRESDIIYPFVETSKFKIAEKLGDYYLIAGRMVPYKRNDIVIEAFNNLDLPLKVVGDGYGLAELKKIAKNPKIEFVGRVSDNELKKYLSECKAFIFAAEEDFGIMPLEAMASGRPVIAYKKGGALETVKEGTTGVFFDRQTSDCLEEVVKKFHPEKYNPYDIREHTIKFDKKNFRRELKGFIDKNISK